MPYAAAEPISSTNRSSAVAGGFVDIHCHVLPGLDDGPRSEHEALLLARAAIRGGTAAVVATPHQSFRYPLDRDSASAELARLEAKLGDDLFLFSGCELEVSDEALRAFAEHPRAFTLNRGRYALIELRVETPPARLPYVCESFQRLGVTPILAHPERYEFVHRRLELLAEWSAAGGLLQATGESFSGRMGRRPRTTAFRLLEADLLDFVASDAHDAVKRPPDLRAAWATVRDAGGEPTARRLFIDNPLRVLRDEPLA